MSSRLHLDVRLLSLGRRHLVNAYEVKAGIGVIAGKTVIHAWAPCMYYKNERYINTFTFFTFSCEVFVPYWVIRWIPSTVCCFHVKSSFHTGSLGEYQAQYVVFMMHMAGEASVCWENWTVQPSIHWTWTVCLVLYRHAPLIRLQHTALYKFVLIDEMWIIACYVKHRSGLWPVLVIDWLIDEMWIIACYVKHRRGLWPVLVIDWLTKCESRVCYVKHRRGLWPVLVIDWLMKCES